MPSFTVPDPLDAPLTPEEEATLARRQPIEEALLEAEAVARRQGEPVLAACLARLELIFDMGMQEHALKLLDKARETILEAIRNPDLNERNADALHR